MSCRLKVYSPLVLLVSLISCGSESRQSVTQEPDVDSIVAESSSPAPPVIISNTPNEQDRFSLLTGQISADSTVIVDSMEDRVNEDERMSVKFVLLEPSYVNVQVSISRNELAEVWTIMEEQFDAPATTGPSPKITDLGFAPLYDDFYSEWVLLQPGRYSTEVDNTNGGSYSPPWNGVNDWFNARVTILAAPEFIEVSNSLQSDDAAGEQVCCGRLVETQFTRVYEEEGF